MHVEDVSFLKTLIINEVSGMISIVNKVLILDARLAGKLPICNVWFDIKTMGNCADVNLRIS